MGLLVLVFAISLGRQRGCVIDYAIAACSFGFIERGVGDHQCPGEARCVIRHYGNANAAADKEGGAIYVHWSFHGGANFLAYHTCKFATPRFWKMYQGDKFIAANSRKHTTLIQCRCNPSSNRGQNAISDCVTVGVVNRLEAVEIDRKHGQANIVEFSAAAT